MAIPESQLVTWTHEGAVATAKKTHESVRIALKDEKSLIRNMAYEAFLQGSYRNDTSIHGDMDVDLIVCLNTTYGYDLADLDMRQTELFWQHFTAATYLWEHFRRDVLASLRSYYGAAEVQEGNKSLKLLPKSGRMPADIVPAIAFRDYLSYDGPGPGEHKLIEGIRFHDRSGREIRNYPKRHIDNGQAKNADGVTDGNYKPTVRMFKNARKHLVDHGALKETVAPSYFIECLLYNMPNALFVNSRPDTMLGILRYLNRGDLDMSKYVCQNGRIYLFGGTPEQWRMDIAQTYIKTVTSLWNTWR